MRYVRTFLALSLLTFPLLAASRFGNYRGVVAQVPFEFVVGGKIVPAGECVVLSSGGTIDTVLIRNLSAKVDVFATASPNETRKPAGTTALTFHKYGDRYFLSTIRLQGLDTVYEVPESRAEAELKAHKVPSTDQTVLSL